MATSIVRAWSSIRSHYVDSSNSEPTLVSMVKLVTEIESSRFATGLFGWTSMHDLCIAQTQVTYPYDGPYLRISPLADGKLEFRYIDTTNAEKQWHRTVDPNEGFARLERFIDQLHWFS